MNQGVATEPKAIEAEGFSPYRWVILVVAYVAWLSDYAAYLSWNPFIPVAKDLFGFSMTQAGSLLTATVLGRMIFQIPGGAFVDRLNMKTVLFWTMVALGVTTALNGLASTYVSALVVRFLIGVSAVTCWPICVKLIITWFPPKEKTTAMGLLATGTAMSIIIVNAIMPPIMKSVGWSYAFYAIGGICLFAALVVLTLMKATPPGQEAPAAGKKKTSDLQTIMILLRNKNLWITLVAFTTAIGATWGTASWTMAYLKKGVGMPLVTAGAMMAAFGVFAGIIKPIIGLVVDKTRIRAKTMTQMNMVVFAVMLVFLPAIKSPELLWVYVPVLGMAAFAYSGPLNLLVAECVEKKMAGTATSIILVGSQIGLLIEPLIIGKVLDVVGKEQSYFVVCAFLAMGAVICFFFAPFIREEKKA